MPPPPSTRTVTHSTSVLRGREDPRLFTEFKAKLKAHKAGRRNAIKCARNMHAKNESAVTGGSREGEAYVLLDKYTSKSVSQDDKFHMDADGDGDIDMHDMAKNMDADGDGDIDLVDMMHHTRRLENDVPFVYVFCFVVLYLLASTLLCSHVFNWSMTNAFYFTVVTFTTVGYGDLTPTTDYQKVFTTFFVVVSVAVIGYCVGIIMAYFTELEKERFSEVERSIKRSVLSTGDTTNAPDASISSSHRKNPRWTDRCNPLSPGWTSLYISLCPVMALLLLAIAIMHVEGWSDVQGLYFLVVSITTVGYGDVKVKTPVAKFMVAAFIVIGTANFAWITSNIMSIPFAHRQEQKEKEILAQYGTTLDFGELRQLAKGGQDGTYCTLSEFTLRMLLNLDMVQEEDITNIEQHFKDLDKTGDGRLDVADVDVVMCVN